MLCNIIPKLVAEALKLDQETGGGWISSSISELEETDGLELSVCFPFLYKSKKLEIKIGNTIYYGFQEKKSNPVKYDSSVEKQFETIIAKETPDIVHIFGTEYPSTLAMVRAFNKPDHTVIHIQGLVSVYARHYCTGLPDSVQKRNTFRDFIKHDNIVQQKKKFDLRGEFEIEALKNVGHVLGRTDWDKTCCEWINPSVKYHYVQETMRSEFYEGKWNYDACEKHSIFMSQGGYPIKGLHLALEALFMLKMKYPDVRLYIAGSDIIHYNGFAQKIRKTYYAQYIMDLIEKWDLKDEVIFLGPQKAQEMKKRYLSSNVFISPSLIENSPNSIGEAMLLGIPIVASDVGGVSSLIRHDENGFLYPADAPYMLSHYIDRIFEDEKLAIKVSETEINIAGQLYNTNEIVNQLLVTYQEMMKSGWQQG